MTTLVTERLTLRRPAPRDWSAFHGYSNSPRAIHTGGLRSPGDIWRTFASLLGHWKIRGWGLFTLTATGDDSAIGLVGPWFPVGWPERELGWMLYTGDHQGKGYAGEAARAARAFVYRDLGWDTAVSYIHPENARSRALAERLGARVDPDATGPGLSPCVVYRHPPAQEPAA